MRAGSSGPTAWCAPSPGLPPKCRAAYAHAARSRSISWRKKFAGLGVESVLGGAGIERCAGIVKAAHNEKTITILRGGFTTLYQAPSFGGEPRPRRRR